MTTKECRIFLVMAMTCFCLGDLFAQPKTIGMSFSFSGIGIEYSHSTDKDSFVEAQIKSEAAYVFCSLERYPGFSASAFWNMIFARRISRNGNEIRIYAGPGITAGFNKDMLASKGLIFGIRGKIGAECSFPRGVAIKLCITPMIGVHLAPQGSMLTMKMYRTGLLYTLMPEIAICYPF